MAVSKLQRVPLRDAFRHEALNFTVWLETNIDALGESLGINLTVLEREKAVGSFNVDLLCEDNNGNHVIIENQLERSDHGHLGQLLTYLVNLEAKTAVWVTSEARTEHQRVIDWLNESTSADFSFYLVQVEAIRIDNSPYAPLFTVITSPDEQTREIGETKKELADRHYHRKEFWTSLLERSKGRTRLAQGRTPGTDHWLSVATGKSGVHYNYLILKDGAAVDLYIDLWDQTKNKAIFDQLYIDKDKIETALGAQLEWRRMDDKRSSRVILPLNHLGSLNARETWPTLQDAMIDAMIKFDELLRPRIARLQV
jgi:hypothetical protein